MSKVIITADSTADLSKDIIGNYPIHIVPLIVNMYDKSYRDGIDVTPDMIYKYVSDTGNLPSTSALSIGEYTDIFKGFVNDGYDVVHISLSSGFSSTHQNASIASEEFDNVFAVDSLNLSTGSGHIVLEAAIMAQNGIPAEKIAQRLNEITGKVDASFVLDDLTFLHKGGRCSSVAKLGANLLKLKPSIQVKDGKMNVSKKYRGDFKNCVVEYVKDKLADKDSIDTHRLFVTHTFKCPDEIVNAAINAAKECAEFDEVIVNTAGCTITTHCGGQTIGVLFFRKENI